MPLSFTELRRAYKAKYPDPAPVWQDIDGTPFVPEFVEDPTHISGYKLTDPRELTLQQRELNDVWWESKFKHLRQQTNNGVINGAEPIFIDASLKHSTTVVFSSSARAVFPRLILSKSMKKQTKNTDSLYSSNLGLIFLYLPTTSLL